MSNFLQSWRKIAGLYVAIILLFAVAYFFLSSGLSYGDNHGVSIVDCFYLSVVTITTLGYGDILPNTALLKILVSFQALIGVGLLGLLINSFWLSRQKAIEEEALIENVNFHLTIIQDYINTYKLTIGEMIAEDKVAFANKKTGEFDLDLNFKFSSLATVFDRSLNTTLSAKYGFFESRVSLFYLAENDFFQELKDTKKEWDLSSQPKLRNSINNFLRLKSNGDVSHAMLKHDRGELIIGDEKSKDAIKKEVEKYDVLPSERILFNEMKNFYKDIHIKISCIYHLEMIIEEILNSHGKSV